MAIYQPNILVDRNGHARLTDFGLASVVRGLTSAPVTKVQGYTERWAAPEVLLNGDRITQEADVFAFGMVVVEVSPSISSRGVLDVKRDCLPDARTRRCLQESVPSASSSPQSL